MPRSEKPSEAHGSSEIRFTLAVLSLICLPILVLCWALITGRLKLGDAIGTDANVTGGTYKTPLGQIERLVLLKNSASAYSSVAAGTSFDGISETELMAAQQFVEKLNDVLAESDDDKFKNLINETAIRNQVIATKNVQKSLKYVRFEDPVSTESWFNIRCPTYSRVKIIGIRSESGFLVADTLAYSPNGCERISWFLDQQHQSNQLAIVDWLEMDLQRFQSEWIAIQLGSSLSDSEGMAHFREIERSSWFTVTSARQTLDELLSRRYPRLMKTEAFLRIANLANQPTLEPQMAAALDKIQSEQLDSPSVWRMKARHAVLKRDYETAIKFLNKIEDLTGPSPECTDMTCSIKLRFNELKDVYEAQLKLLKLNSDLFDAQLLKDFPGHRASEFVEIMRTRPTPAADAMKLAWALLDLDMRDLAEPLIRFVNSLGKSPYSLALNARESEFRGELELAIQQYRDAWSTAKHDDPQRELWISEWAELLRELDRGSEAIRAAPNPVAIFHDLTFHEGRLRIKPDIAERHIAALSESSVADEWLVAKKFLVASGKTTVAFARQDYPKAYEFAKRALGDPKSLLDLNFLDVEQAVRRCHARTGVETGRMAEVQDLLPYLFEHTVLFECCREFATRPQPNFSPMSKFVDLHLAAHPKDSNNVYYKGCLNALSPGQRELRGALLRALAENDWDSFEELFSWLIDDAVENKDLIPSIAGVRYARGYGEYPSSFEYIVRRLIDYPEKLEEFLSHPATSGQVAESELLHVQLAYYESQRNWAKVVEIYRNAPEYFTDNPQALALVFDALVATGDLNAADSLAENFECGADTEKLMVARGQVDELLANAQECPDILHLHKNPAIWGLLQSNEFSEFRSRFPENLATSSGQELDILVSDAIRIRLQDLLDLPCLKAVSVDVGTIPKSSQSEPSRFRIDLPNISFVLEVGEGQFKFAGRSEIERSLSKSEWQKLNAHRGWFRINYDWASPEMTLASRNRLMGRIVSDLVENVIGVPCVAILGDNGLSLVSDISMKRMTEGRIHSRFAIPLNPLNVTTARNRKAERRRAALVSHLTQSTADSPAPVDLELSHNGVQFSLRLEDWAPGNRPERFIVRLPDSPAFALAQRNKRVIISKHQVQSWSKSTAAP